MQLDPRTVARDIPGIVDEIFPHLTPGAVAHFNSGIIDAAINGIPSDLLASSKMQKALVFELAYSVADSLLSEKSVEWERCLGEAIERQRAFFNALPPASLEAADKEIALIVGRNLASLLKQAADELREPIKSKPFVPGLEWVANGKGDFAIADTLIEVKCTATKFSSADYRQVAIYWLMSYSASLEGRGTEWRRFILLNPRRGEKLSMTFDSLLSSISGSRTKVDILQLFQSLIGTRAR